MRVGPGTDAFFLVLPYAHTLVNKGLPVSGSCNPRSLTTSHAPIVYKGLPFFSSVVVIIWSCVSGLINLFTNFSCVDASNRAIFCAGEVAVIMLSIFDQWILVIIG